MHIPDGFLDAKTWGGLAAVSGAVVGAALSQVRKKLDDKDAPMMGVMAAFVFAAQMLNFPVGGGTSGHFMGGVLAAILLGPWAATLIMTTVLIVQCLVFQDGGLLALGANVFNMAIVGVWSGWLIYKLVIMVAGNKGRRSAVFVASWASIVLAASACALELAFSGTTKLGITLPAMAGVHALIGIGEGLITLSVVELVGRVRPDIAGIEFAGGAS